MINIVAYCMGEPEIGEEHQVFRDVATLKDFILGLPERNLVELYKVTGRLVEDDDRPDGLVLLVLQYELFKFTEN